MAKDTGGTAALADKPISDGKVTTRVLEQISKMRTSGGITLPADYDVANALNSAWLYLQTVQNMGQKNVIKDGKVDESVVTLNSVANALHDYCIQGLNCAKKQAYFIVYGQALTCQRSYFGDMLVAQRVRPNIDFYFDVIYKGEDLQVEKVWSKEVGLVDTVKSHTKEFPRKSAEIVGAYCGVVDTETGENLGMILMDIDRIKRSWGMSKTYKPDGSGTHNKFPDEMALRTVIRKRCKAIINASNDAVLLESVRRQDMDAVEADIAEDAAEHANKEPLALSERQPDTTVDGMKEPKEPVKQTVEATAEQEQDPAAEGEQKKDLGF